MLLLRRALQRQVYPQGAQSPQAFVRRVPLLPGRHSATTGGARLLPRLNAVGDVASVFPRSSTAGVGNVAESMFANRAGAVSPPYSASSSRSVEDGGLAPSPQKLNEQFQMTAGAESPRPAHDAAARCALRSLCSLQCLRRGGAAERASLFQSARGTTSPEPCLTSFGRTPEQHRTANGHRPPQQIRSFASLTHSSLARLRLAYERAGQRALPGISPSHALTRRTRPTDLRPPRHGGSRGRSGTSRPGTRRRPRRASRQRRPRQRVAGRSPSSRGTPRSGP